MIKNKSRKKTVFIGAGIVGLVAILEYIKEKISKNEEYDVTVIEKNSPGSGSSFANGGNLTIAEGLPLARSVNLNKISTHFPEGWKLNEDLTFSGRKTWLEKFKYICLKGDKNWLNRAKVITELGKQSLNKWQDFTNEYPEISKLSDFNYGTILRLYKNQNDLANTHELWKELKIPSKILSFKEMVEFEPIYRDTELDIAGAVAYPGGSINPYKFTNLLAILLQEKFGVKFCYNAQAQKLIAQQQDTISEIATNNGNIKAEQVVVSTCASLDFLKDSNIYDYIQPIGGFTLTIPTTESARLSSPLKYISEDGVIVFSPHTQARKLRLGGFFFLADSSIDGKSHCFEYAFKKLELYLASLFPQIYEYADSQRQKLGDFVFERWYGVRPVTTDGIPMVGNYFYKNLFLNIGQGAAGSSYSFACAKKLCEFLQ